MPLVRYAIQNEYKLGNLEFYRTASKDDPKSMLEGVTMVGLVGILRQLGDLAEFAAELFHDLHEEIMATAARGHDLVARVLQLEAEVPYIEKVLSDSDPLRFCSMPGVDWHATIRSDQNHFTQGDLPRFIRSSYEECRGPPRLFLLDKFDVGAEACLRRYTDPSFFKRQWASTELTKAEKAQQERKARSRKKKAIRRTNIEDIYNPALAPRLKPRRVRYSSLSSDNLDCFLDSSSLLSTGNQFNSSFKPMDTVSITENNENLPFNAMSISVLKEPTPPSSISQTAGLIVNKAKDPAEAVIVEALIMTSKGKELKEERRRTLGSSSKVNEEQSMLDKEEGKGSLEAFSLEKIASNFSIDSDRFEDAMTAQSETDSDIVKLNFTDNDDDNDNKDNFTLQVRDAECNSKVDFTQETGQTSVRTQHFVSESVDLGRLAQNSGILQAHAENLKKSVSGVTSEIDIYEDAMNTHSGIDSEAGANQAGQVESMSLSTADCMLNKHVEVLAKEEFLPDAVKSRERLSWKTSETSIDRGFVKDLNVPPENVLDLKELISNSSSDLDKFEDAVGAELDTGSQATSMLELNDISSLQGIPAKIVCTTTPFLEFCKDNKIEPVQNIPEDRMQDILEGDGWRQGDFPTSTPEPTDKNEVYSSYLGKCPLDPMNEKRDALGKLLHLDTSSASDDLCETKNKCLQASDLASNLHGACDGKLTQLDHAPPQTMVSNGTGLPNDLVRKEQPVAETIKPEEVTDNILVGQKGFADGNTPEQPDSLASVLAVGKDGMVSVADFRVHTRQTMGPKSGISKFNTHIEGTEEEDFEEDFGTDNEPQPHMIKTGGKHDHLSLLKPLHVTTNPQTDMLYSSDAEVVETVSAYSDSSGPTSVPFKLGSYDPSYSRTSSENYREDHSVQDSSIKEGSQSQGLEYSDLLIAKPAAHVDALLGSDVRISTQWSKSERQSKSKDSFLPFISRSPPLSPISSFELPAGVHKLHGKVRDAKDENSMLLHMDQTARPKLTIDVTPDDSPAISPIVSPMWSSESPTACDEPQKMFAQDQDERLPSQSPSLPSSPASPTTPREQHDFISDAELKHSVRSSPRDAILNTLASSTISVPSEGLSSGCIDKKGLSPQLTSSPSLSATSPPTFPASQNSRVENFDEERKISMVLSCEPTPNNGELLIPLSESLPSEDSEPSLNKPKPDVLGQVIQPTSLAIKESPIREVGTSSLRMRSGSASPDSVKSPSRTSKDQVPSNEAGESFFIKSMSVSPELGSTTPSSVKLEANPLPSFSLEGETSTTYEELSISTEAAPAAPAPPASTPPRKPPKSFHGLSRESTTNPSPGDHRRDIVDSISMSSLSKLRKVSIQAPPPKPRNVNDREVLLEQIRTQSFNLRHTTVKKRELPSRPVPNINVAAILEKAYSMRQAVVGSDEDRDSDGWSDQ